jgi:hypothetical protein
MRSLSLGMMILCVFLAVRLAAEDKKPPVDLTGSWSFVWDANPANANTAVLKHEAGIISGTYFNDSKEKCAVAGRLASSGNVLLTIVCSGWEIQCDGVLDGSKSAAGKYIAYGSSDGTFQMTRKPAKP